MNRLRSTLALLLVYLPGISLAGPLLIGGDHDFSPFESIDPGGQAIGLNIDLIQAIADLNDIEIEVRLTPWWQSRQAIREASIDVLPMFVDPVRKPEVSFASPHVILHHEIFVRIGATPLLELSELTGRSIIVERDAWIHEHLISLNFPADLVLVESEVDALKLLAASEHDAAIVGSDHGRHMMRLHDLSTLTTSGPPVFPVSYALAVPAGRDDLLDMLNQGLEHLRSSGEFNLIHARWLGREPASEETPVAARPSVWLILLALLTAAVLAGLATKRRSKRTAAAGAWASAADRIKDSVTGLPQRSAMDARLMHLAQNGQTPVHLLYIDIDQFQLVNERADHQLGDEILRQFGAALTGAIGDQVLVSRTFSDEFCALLSEFTDAEALALAERVRQSLSERRFEYGDERFALTVCIGVAGTSTLDPDQIGEFIKQAETACQAAKALGRNRVHAYHPEDEAVMEKHSQLNWMPLIQEALNKDSLLLHYQPIIPARSGSGAALVIEVLVRLPGADGVPINAGCFMPSAEKYFLAQRIDRWVIKSTLHWLNANRDQLQGLAGVNINLSAQTLSDDRFLPFVAELLDQYPLPGITLCFEVTETAIMTQMQQGIRTMNALRERGVQLAMDDFGAGNTSVALLRQLPIDQVKIDGRFMRQLVDDEQERQLLSELNDLAHLLGKTTVAEMIEDERTLSLVAELGADFVQGYAVGRPQPIDELPGDLVGRQASAGPDS